jgi:hypothetical protein
MLSFPDDHEHTVASIVAEGKEGREAVRATLRELEHAGHVAFRTVLVDQPNGGHLTRQVIDVYDTRGMAPASTPRRRRPAPVRWQPGDTLAGGFDDPLPADGFAVYRLYGREDRLLYIGRTTQPQARFKAHVRVWAELLVRWEMTAYATHDEMCRAEVEEIRRYRPALNRGTAR